ncbi:MAG TPA: hypothetical protein VGW76_17340 [Pyrinomonadaceae bacterium]|nr:hypothetical protein [Pyrinomonadaceae bacterium]
MKQCQLYEKNPELSRSPKNSGRQLNKTMRENEVSLAGQTTSINFLKRTRGAVYHHHRRLKIVYACANRAEY